MEKYTDQDIDNFILDLMEAEEHLAFCEELDRDEELREKVILRQLIVDAERSLTEKEARAILERRPQGRMSSKRFRIVAMAIAAAVIGAVFIIGNVPQYSPQEIYRDYYSAPMIERARSGAGLSMEESVVNNEIIMHFESREYELVMALYQKQWGSRLPESVSPSTALYIAISYMESDLPKQAIPVLRQITDITYKEETQWLLLCAYLGADDKKQAAIMADEIVKNSLFYKEKAKEIQTKLKERAWF